MVMGKKSQDPNSPYSQLMENIVSHNEHGLETGSSPDVVAKVVLKAATSENPNLRYLAGRDIETVMELKNLIAYLARYRDNLTCDPYPSHQLLKYESGHLNQKLSLTDYMQAYIDFLRVCIPSYQLQNNITAVNMAGYSFVYSFDLNNKLQDTKYVTMQLYVQKADRIYIFSYNALNDSFWRYLPTIEKMIKSIVLL